MAFSTAEAEYIAAAEAVKEALWMKGISYELGLRQESIYIYCDSQSTIQLSKNHVYHERTKHIDVRFHFIRDEVGKRAVKLVKIDTEDNPADAFTKALPSSKFRHCLSLLNVTEIKT